jgi:hypothetical protein
LLDHFMYSGGDPSTPAYFKAGYGGSLNACSPFALPHGALSPTRSMVEGLSQGHEPAAPSEQKKGACVEIFSSYDDTFPSGSFGATGPAFIDSSGLGRGSDHIFGAMGCEDEAPSLELRMFGMQLPGALTAQRSGEACTAEGDERRGDFFGSSVLMDCPADELGMGAKRSTIERKLFGDSAGLAVPGGEGELEMGTSRRRLSARLFGSGQGMGNEVPGEDELDMDSNRSKLTSRLFGSSSTGTWEDDVVDRDTHRSKLSSCLFGTADCGCDDEGQGEEVCAEAVRSMSSRRRLDIKADEEDGLAEDELDRGMNRSKLTCRLFGSAIERAEAEDKELDIAASRGELSARLFGVAQEQAGARAADLDVDVSLSLLASRLFGSQAERGQAVAEVLDVDANRSMLTSRQFGSVTERGDEEELDLEANRSMLASRLFGASAVPPDEDLEISANRKMLATRLFGRCEAPALSDADAATEQQQAERLGCTMAVPLPPAAEASGSDASDPDLDASHSTLAAKLSGSADGEAAVDCQDRDEKNVAAGDSQDEPEGLDMDTNRNTLTAKLFGTVEASEYQELDMDANRDVLATRLFGVDTWAAAAADTEDVSAARGLLETRLFGHAAGANAAEVPAVSGALAGTFDAQTLHRALSESGSSDTGVAVDRYFAEAQHLHQVHVDDGAGTIRSHGDSAGAQETQAPRMAPSLAARQPLSMPAPDDDSAGAALVALDSDSSAEDNGMDSEIATLQQRTHTLQLETRQLATTMAHGNGGTACVTEAGAGLREDAARHVQPSGAAGEAQADE